MRKKELIEWKNNYKFENNKWYTFSDIDSINLNKGNIIFPDYNKMLFAFNKNNDILIKYGKSEIYGEYLYNYIPRVPVDSIEFIPKIYSKNIYPKPGDVIKIITGNKVEMSIIRSISKYSNAERINLSNRVWVTSDSKISYYDPGVKGEFLFPGNIETEIYKRFNENPSNKKDKILGGYHVKLKSRNIININMR